MIKTWREKLLSATAAWAVLVATGPFATYSDLSVPLRALYWLVAVAGVGGVMIGCRAAVSALPWAARLSPEQKFAAGLFLGSFPAVLVVHFIELAFRGGGLQSAGFMPVWIGILAISAVIGIVDYRIESRAASDEGTTPPPPFLRKLSSGMGQDLISLQVHDHYLEVVTEAGREMILYRMADAVAELDGMAGMQIHRSHWVALSKVRQLRRVGSSHVVELSDGREVPVSRPNVATLRGLLHGAAG